MNIGDNDFGILAVCAIRYCHGRMTYMPELVRGVVRAHISEVTDKDLQVMINDCEHQHAFGHENIDKPKWIEWKDFLIDEQKRRQGVYRMTIEELKNLCTKNYPDNCKECPMYKNDCENYEKGHKWQDIDRVLPKDWSIGIISERVRE